MLGRAQPSAGMCLFLITSCAAFRQKSTPAAILLFAVLPLLHRTLAIAY
jgi:hypothetical protein